MANASYVMYENTLSDLRDVYADMRNRAEEDLDAAEYGEQFERLNEPLSESETMARAQLIDLCRRIVELADRPDEDEIEEDEQAEENKAAAPMLKELLEEALTEPDDVVQPFRVFSQDIEQHFDLNQLPVSKGNHRYLITDEWFIWRDEEHYFLSKVSDPEYYYQLKRDVDLEEAFDVMEADDDSYGYKDQKNFD